MKTAEIRSRFLGYFERNGHTVVESSSLVPQNDPTLLFTNAGMVQFKDVFLGNDPRPYTRATSSQKCVRAGGKHNDLENVGFTARHHTFFEMLGNFSFGDYFKKDAIRYAWEFVTRELGLPKDRLYVTVFEKDNEAADLWNKQEGVARDRIFRFGEKDNFWSMGDTGPCGPCSEIFIDRGEKHGCGKPSCAIGCDCDRYMEFWNLVFMQFNRDASGKLTPLPKPSVDTGAGLERIASILQEVDSNYDTDGFRHIIGELARLSRKDYDQKGPLAAPFRAIADHARAATFLVGDGVMPSNEGRGYVLRRILRRAIRLGKKLGFNDPFLSQACTLVVDQMKDAYPDLVEKRPFITKAVRAEEEQFFKTLDRGLTLLGEELVKLGPATAGAQRQLPGEVAFKLYDTYGFPLDLTRVIMAEAGGAIDEGDFEKAMDLQRAESRKHWKGSGQEALDAIYLKAAADLRARGKLPKFVGYEKTSTEGECVAILVAFEPGGSRDEEQGLRETGAAAAPALAATRDSGERGAMVEAVFAVTPFYGESGGQVGDRGRVTGPGFEAEAIDVQRPVPDLIVAHLHLKRGTLETGKKYLQETDAEIRALTARNHTATHLLHWALREVLGKHVKQAGSLVAPDLLRFDFSHFQAMTGDELLRVENLVNERIWNAYPVAKREMPKNEAVAAGAIAFFGEKYGDRVRVVSIGDFSTELCGGTHVDTSADIHLFKIVSEGGIAAGVRRMIAYTSKGAFEHLRKRDALISELREQLKANNVEEIPARVERMNQTERELRKQIEQLQARSASGEVDEMLASAKTIAGGKLVAALCAPSQDGIKRLRDIADRVKQKAPDSVVVLGMKDPGSEKASLLVAVGPSAPKQWNASALLKDLAPLIDGRGGGKPDLAQAGGTRAAGLAEALEKAKNLVV